MNHAQHQEKAAQARRDYLQSLLAVFGNDAGARVLRALHTAAATRKPSYTPGGNVNDTLWRDGRKSIVLELEEHLQTAREEFGKAEPAIKPPVTARKRARRGTDPAA